MAAAYRPSSGAEWEGADRSAAAAEVSQGCGGVGGGFFSTGWNGVAAGWQGGLEATPGAGQSCHITSRTVPGAGRGHRGAGAGGRRQSQQLKVQTSPEEQEVSEEGWGQARPVQLCQVSPGLGLCTPGLCFSDRTPTELI